MRGVNDGSLAINQLVRVNTAREQWVEFLIPLCLAVSGRDASQTDQKDTLAVVGTFRHVLAAQIRAKLNNVSVGQQSRV